MKNILMAIMLIVIFQGCELVDYLEKQNMRREFKSLCERYSLAMCGDILIPNYNNADYLGIRAVVDDIDFTYVADDVEQYDYMEAPHRGDCEDWTITFIENNLRLGNFEKGQVEWVFGYLNGEGHAWTIVTKNGETLLFDNGFTWGTPIDKAYSDYGYRERRVVYKY